MYQNYPYLHNNYNYETTNDRQFFFPFLVGAVAGGAAVGLTRPRPIYNTSPQNQYYPQQPYYTTGAPYSNYSYSYYVPYR